MKATLLLVLGLLSAAAALYVLMVVDRPSARAAAETTVARAVTTEVHSPDAAADAPAIELHTAPVIAPSDVPAVTDRRTLDGTLLDRFGSPVAGERVFLVPKDGDHPAETANLTDYVTALTSPSGAFSLSLTDDGPWRLAVGPPGQPRLPISSPRLVTQTTRAEVVVPGAAVLRVTFDELPGGEEPIRLEVLSLREPRAAGEGRRGGRNRTERGSQTEERTRNRGRGRAGENGANNGRGRRGAADEGKAQDGDGRQSALDVRTVAPTAGPVAQVASLAQEGNQEDSAEGRRGQRGRGRRGQQRGTEDGGRRNEPDSDEGAVQGPPPEQWRALRRHELTPAERESRVVEFERFPAGPVCRLALFQGDLGLEGAARFTLQNDAVLEIRVLPFVGGPSASLSYTSSLQFLAPEDRPAGFHWRD